jgi:hypothetical protein
MRIFTFLLFLLFAYGVHAQSTHELVINAPSPAAGSYLAQIASFGAFRCSVEGDLVLVRDNAGLTLGCGSITNDLTGKIAVIDRGTCSFSEKVLNAQLKGAIAAIVINNNSTAPELINMGATQPFAAQVTIPSFFMIQGQGTTVKNALAQGVRAKIVLRPFLDPDSSITRTVVWGATPGQGDFNGGLSGWRVNNIWCSSNQSQPKVDLWRWAADGATPVTTCGRGIISSPTACNGAAMFSSNLLDDKGTECGAGLGSGDCPTTQLGELISPTIKLRGPGSPGYQLKFYQYVRQLSSSYFVLWSVNGGTRWDTLQINQGIAANTVNTSPLVVLPLEGTANADSLIVKFLHLGNYYHWIIDDVQILAQEASNLRVNDFYAIPPNFATPLSQVEPFGFLADVENIGSLAQDNVLLSVDIKNQANQTVFSANNPYGSIPANTLVENKAFANSFQPAAKGNYTGTYTISGSLTDFDLKDNTRTFNFVVTDSTFAKEDGGALRAINPASTNWAANEPHSAAYGNVFFVPKGKGKFSRRVTFALSNATPLKDRGLIVALYKWTDTNSDGLCQPAERTLAGINVYTVLGTESTPLRFIDVQLPAPGEAPIELEDNATYLVMLEYYAPDADGVDLQALVSDQFDYKAQFLLSDGLKKPRYTSMTGLAGDLTQETYSPLGYSNFPGDYSYLVRWHISGDAGATPVREVPSIADQVAVFPNPTSDLLNIQFALREQSNRMEAVLMDVSGRVVYRNVWDGVFREVKSIPTDVLPAGIYVLKLHSEAGTAVKKIVIDRN